VLIQTENRVAQCAVLPVTLNGAVMNRTKSSIRRRVRTGPHRALAILQKSKNHTPFRFLVLNELTVLPTCQSFVAANPQSSIPGYEQLANHCARELLPRWRLPG